MKSFIAVFVFMVYVVATAWAGELRHWQAVATDSQPCGWESFQHSNFQNPEPQTIYIRKIHLHVNAAAWALINAYLTQGWDQRSSLAFHVSYGPTFANTDRWSDFSPYYVSLVRDARIWFEYGCGGGGAGQFYLTIFYTLEP